MRSKGKAVLFFIMLSVYGTSVYAQNQAIQNEINRQQRNSQSAWGNCLVSDTWILSDYSGSMEGYESRVFGAAHEIGNGILKENAKARVGVLLFNDQQTVVQQLTNDKVQLNQSLDLFRNVGAEGGTQIYRAMLATEYLQNTTPTSRFSQDGDFRKIIILISDGEDGSSEKSLKVAQYLKAQGWIIYSIFVHRNDVSPEEEGGYQFLKSISGNHIVGSSYVDSVLLDDLPRHFREKFTCI